MIDCLYLLEEIMMPKKPEEGDIYYSESEGKYYPFRVLRIDRDFPVFHVLTYYPIQEKPTTKNFNELEVFIWHTPIANLDEATFLINQPVRDEELHGYYTYLKMTHFQRYIEETGQNLDDVTNQATSAFREALALSDEGKIGEAIQKYSEAFDLFPLFYEALDNRAFLIALCKIQIPV